MCFSSSPSAPAAAVPLPAQAPLPAPVVLDTSSSAANTSNALAANKGRSQLRIDRTQSLDGGAGTGLNIPL